MSTLSREQAMFCKLSWSRDLDQADMRPNGFDDTQNASLGRDIDTNTKIRLFAIHEFQEISGCLVGKIGFTGGIGARTSHGAFSIEIGSQVFLHPSRFSGFFFAHSPIR